PIVVALKGSPRDTGLNLEQLLKLDEYFESISPKYRHLLDDTKMAVIDAGVLSHQIPGGMFSNMIAQLKEAKAIDKLSEVYKELPQTRKELGFPPLVTPTSQIVGTQAVMNVLFGRYKMISREVKDYVYGLYGASPAQIDPEVQKIVLKGYEGGDKPITCRPADTLKPEMEEAKKATKDIARDMGDVLAYALYPTTGMRFLRWKYGLEAPPPETKAKTLEDMKREAELVAKAKAGKLVERVKVEAPAKGPAIRTYSVFVGDEYYKVDIEPVGAAGPVVSAAQPIAAAAQPAASPPPPPAAAAPKAEAPPKGEPAKAQAPTEVKGTAITAPLPGLITKVTVKVGDTINAGDPVCLLEAMKMENNILATVAGTVKALNVKAGDSVAVNAVIAIIG
ncbi:MAG: biotin/lipoyl-containing protein, partial [Chloroflexota bacterium]